MTPAEQDEMRGRELAPRRRTLLDISNDILSRIEAREMAEEEGDAERVKQLDVEMQHFLGRELAQKVDSIRNVIRELDAQVPFFKEEAATMRERAKRAEADADRLRGYVLSVMQQTGVEKYRGEKHWLRRQKSGGIRALTITDPELVPDSMKLANVSMPLELWNAIVEMMNAELKTVLGDSWEIEEQNSPNKDRIRAALERGEVVPGCKLEEQGEHLRMD